MAKAVFIDKYGFLTENNGSAVATRQKDYVIIKNADTVICRYDTISGLFSFPEQDEVAVNTDSEMNFSILASIHEDEKFIKEKQNYRVYFTKIGKLKNTKLQKCKIADILVNRVRFDATQKQGLKNLLVRVKK